MFRKLLKVTGAGLAAGGVYLSTKEKKITTGSPKPPTLTEAQLAATADRISPKPEGFEYYPYFSSLDGLNFDHFRRKRAFQLGDIPILKEELGEDGKLRNFWDMLDMLPVQMKKSVDLKSL